MDNDAKELFQTKENYEKQIITLKNQIEEERITVMKSINQTNEQIQKIRFEVEDIIGNVLSVDSNFKNFAVKFTIY